MIINLFRHSAMKNHKDTKNTKEKICGKLLSCLFVVPVLLILLSTELWADGQPEKAETPAPQTEEGPWTGIDVSIVGKYAAKYGRPPRDPYINTDQGDLLLFVFTFAGVVGGFVMGFNARKIFYEK